MQSIFDILTERQTISFLVANAVLNIVYVTRPKPSGQSNVCWHLATGLKLISSLDAVARKDAGASATKILFCYFVSSYAHVSRKMGHILKFITPVYDDIERRSIR